MPARPAISALVLLLAAAAPALAAPPVPAQPFDGAVVATQRPTFAWSAGTSAVPVDHYEVLVETAGGAQLVARAPAGRLSARSDVDLPDDGAYRWFVRLVSASGGTASTPVDARPTVRVATVPGPPALSDPAADPASPGARTFSWAGDRATSAWSLTDDAGQPVRGAAAPAASGRVTLTGLTDGAYAFRVVQLNSAGVAGPAAVRTFAIDATAPGPLAVSDTGGAGAGPFAWTGMEPGAVATWRVTAADGTVADGPSDTGAGRAAPGPLRPGAYAFEVRQTDPAGNTGPWSRVTFRVASSSPAPPAAAATTRPSWRRRTRLLSPSAGASVATLTPVLRWARGPRGTGAYNLQVFRVLPGGRMRTELSVFPSGTRYALPRRAGLTPGACFVWRVWPYRGRTYTAAPLAVSDFCVRPRSRGASAAATRPISITTAPAAASTR